MEELNKLLVFFSIVLKYNVHISFLKQDKFKTLFFFLYSFLKGHEMILNTGFSPISDVRCRIPANHRARALPSVVCAEASERARLCS